MKHTILTLSLIAATASCGGAGAQPVAPAPPQGPSRVEPTARVDTSWDVASGYCEDMWTTVGMNLHETPEWDNRRGLDCVYDYPAQEPYLCDENGGAEVVGHDMRLCVVPVSYTWACRWIAPAGRCLD